MTALREYLIRVVVCAFLVSLSQAAASGERCKRALRLAGGCVMILAVLRPLVGLNPAVVGQILPELPGWRSEAMKEAEEKNRQLLRDLIVSQTEAHIQDRAAALSAHVEIKVTVKETEEGVYVPWSAELTGILTAEQKRQLAETLEQELAIPPERQIWRLE